MHEPAVACPDCGITAHVSGSRACRLGAVTREINEIMARLPLPLRWAVRAVSAWYALRAQVRR